MRMRAILILGFLSLTVATVTLARQQPGNLAKPDQKHEGEHHQPGIASVAALRAQVAKLRAEVELLELEHEASKTDLLEALKGQRHADSASEQAAKATEKAYATMMTAAYAGKLDEIKKLLGDEEGIQRAAEREVKEQAERGQGENDRKKKAFVRLAAELHEKEFSLADLEGQLSNAK